MKGRIGVLTANTNLYNKLRLLLRERCEVVMLDRYEDGYALVLTDADTRDVPEEKTVVMSSRGGDVPLPFRHEDILALTDGADDGDDEKITLVRDGRRAILGDETIKLTELEYRLLELLLSRAGEYVSREELLTKIWDEECDGGVVNVYVHYLRQKLERRGQKIILSSRKLGYAIDKKYGRCDKC